jgi:hypothetical protein
MELEISITTNNMRRKALALVDSGCTKTSIDSTFARTHKIPLKPAQFPVKVFNADGSINGYVKNHASLEMEIEDSDGAIHTETIDAQVVNLGGNHDIFISYDWLKKHNPQINWRLKEFQLPCNPEQCNITHPATRVQSLEEYIQLLNNTNEKAVQHESEHIRAFQTTSTRIAGEAPKQEVHIPRHYREFKDVFEKKEFNKLPERRPWDHKIELLPGAEAD